MAGATAKRVTGWILLLTAIAFVVGFVFLLFADAENLDNVPGVDDVPVIAIVTALVLAVIAVILAILLILNSDQSDPEPERRPEPVDDDRHRRTRAEFATSPARHHTRHGTGRPRKGPEPVDLSLVPVGESAWGAAQGNLYPFHFPRKLPGAVFSNDYISIGGGNTLRLGTVIAARKETLVGLKEPAARAAASTGAAAPTSPVPPASPHIDRPERPRYEAKHEVPEDDFMAELDRLHAERRAGNRAL